MTTPCSLLCLLAISLDFRPSPDIQKCSYCVQIRGLTQSCSQDPRDCAEWEPDSLIYCLSRDEQYWGREALLKRSTRCISHSNLLNNQTLISELAQIPQDTQYRCTFDRAQECKCPDCIYARKQPPIFQEIERIEADNHQDSNKEDLGKNLQDITQKVNKLINEEDKTFTKISSQKLKRNKQKHTTRIEGTPLRRQVEQQEEEKYYNKSANSIPFWPADFLYQFNGTCNVFNILFFRLFFVVILFCNIYF
uniref:Uncharacterized protein n=1 Tax=Meloidogyne enterolobii TaxID=390850 RepID=A0A6V7UH41_MELEN|nr:unnamed protein product [Meloidogyne enterolobii]